MAIQLIGIPGYLFFAATSDVDVTPVVSIHFINGVAGVVGLYGYVYRRAIFLKVVWAIFAVFFLVWDVSFQTEILGEDGSFLLSQVNVSPFILFTLVLYLPQYFALLQYGFDSNDTWGLQPSKSLKSGTPQSGAP